MPKKRPPTTPHFERVPLEKVMEIARAGGPQAREAATDGVGGEPAADTEPSPRPSRDLGE